MPTFCRHNRFIQNCPICSGHAAPDPRDPQAAGEAPAPRARAVTLAGGRARAGTQRHAARQGMRVRRSTRATPDGYHCALVPGLRASSDAARLAQELAFATARLEQLALDPPGLYREAATAPDREEGIWLAFLIAYLSPTEGPQPFAAIAAARTSWTSGAIPRLEGVAGRVATGPRSAHDPRRGTTTIVGYRTWARRAGSQAAALEGEPAWTPQRRFERVFERLALPGFTREARIDFLTTVAALELVQLSPATLRLGGDDATTVAAKQVFGIADALLLDRRASALAAALELPLAAFELGLWNWAAGTGAAGAPALPAGAQRATLGAALSAPPAELVERIERRLGL